MIDWFGRKAKAEVEKLQHKLTQLEGESWAIKDNFDSLRESFLRVIAQLREMDQHTYNLYQAAPDWERMRPTLAKMNDLVEVRMKLENNQIRNLVTHEVVKAYSTPNPAGLSKESRRLLENDK